MGINSNYYWLVTRGSWVRVPPSALIFKIFNIMINSIKKKRPGVNSKCKNSKNKNSKNYVKPYRGQGR